VTHRSGSSLRGEHPARSGNRKLKRTLFLPAFTALHGPTKSHLLRPQNALKARSTTLLCLARRRCDVLYAMLENKTLYRTPAAAAA